MITTEKFNFINVVRRALESWWLVPAVFFLGAIFWFFSLSLVTVAVFSFVAVLILLFCKKVNNFFALFLFVSFFIKNVDSPDTPWIGYIVCIGIAVICLIAYTIKTIVLERKTLKWGDMWIAVLVSSIAFLLGGVIGRFNIMNFAIVLGFSVATYILYFLARNKTENLEKYLAYLFVVGALFLTLIILVGRLRLVGKIFIGYPEGELYFFSAQPLNPASIYIMLGMVGCYRLGKGKRLDLAYFGLSLLLFVSVVLTCCRTTILVAGLALVAIFVSFVLESKKKLNFLWLSLAICGVLIVLGVVFRNEVVGVFNTLFEKVNSGLNGRGELWPWCIDRFKEYPIFGYGFVADQPLPSLREFSNVVMAHKTALQWLTSLGIVGSLAMCYFYFQKYWIIFRKFNKKTAFVAISVLAIALTGTFDQAPTMDIFTYVLSLLLVASVERLKGESVNKNSSEKLKGGDLALEKPTEEKITEEILTEERTEVSTENHPEV